MTERSQVRDVEILRDLARRYAEVAAQPIQDERRDLWRQHNSLIRTRPLIYVRAFAWREMAASELQCEDPFYRAHENYLRQELYRSTFGDDYIIEPWITQRATHVIPPEGPWGVKVARIPSPDPRGAWKYDPPLKEPEDIARLVPPHHVIDEAATARNVARLQDAVGDILEVNVSRAPLYTIWHADISTDLAYLRELGQLMWDMVDRPAWLHELLAFMRDGVLRTHQEAEDAGDWRLADHYNQAMAYAMELEDPRANSEPVTRDALWVFVAAQEMAQVGPAMHDEFMLQYQLPIMSHFGLASYGCCEDLTHKIDILRQIPNLRRIAVSPFASAERCAEQIGETYVMSWRPSPAEMVSLGFDPDRVRRVTRDALAAADANGCHIDITLKDVETVQGDPRRVPEWVRVVRETIGLD
ncbi:MAG: hypothetical protein JXA09_01795 [Anaerolineae bacterium]|nr:hypothetical protein [Anaerolineae bacterium]